MGNLYQELEKYSKTDFYPFHMPGHKRNVGFVEKEIPCEIDITEITGFDDLHHAKGLIKSAQERAARVFGAEESRYLVNGSTVGILSAIMGCTSRGDKILIARNCHKSAYNAVELNGLVPVYIYPRFYTDAELNGPIVPEDVKEILAQEPDIQAIVITSPTYDGVVSDVKKISELAHERGIPLIVDEAHGAHFGFHPYFPKNANTSGADVVIHSIHKTLPSLTQTALLHMNGKLVNRKKIEKYLHMLQSSSPSYVLMAGMDACIVTLEEKRNVWFEEYVEKLVRTRKELEKLERLKLLEPGRVRSVAQMRTRRSQSLRDGEQTQPINGNEKAIGYDRSKILVSVKDAGITSRELTNILRERYHLELEMTAGSYVLAMTSVADTEEGLRRLVEAFRKIDEELDAEIKRRGCEEVKVNDSVEERDSIFSIPVLKMWHTNSEMEELSAQQGTKGLSWTESVGHISAEYAYIYPPGIPLIVPGEEISREAAERMLRYEQLGFSVEGMEAEGKIRCVENG